MPPPLILLTLLPPLNIQPQPIEASLPLVRCHLSSRLPLVRRLVVPSPVVTCIRLASPFIFVRASWVSRRISLHCLCLSMCCRLTPGCAIAIADVQVKFPLMCRHLHHHCDCDCHPRCTLSSWCRCPCRCRRHQRPSPFSLPSYPITLLPSSSTLLLVALSSSLSTSSSIIVITC